MATIEFKGIEAYAKMLTEMGQHSTGIIKAAVYEGADVVADAMRNAVGALPVISEHEAIKDWRQQRPSDGITAAQKQGLAEGLGLSPMKDEGGYIYTKAGFAGYNNVHTKLIPTDSQMRSLPGRWRAAPLHERNIRSSGLLSTASRRRQRRGWALNSMKC